MDFVWYDWERCGVYWRFVIFFSFFGRLDAEDWRKKKTVLELEIGEGGDTREQ